MRWQGETLRGSCAHHRPARFVEFGGGPSAALSPNGEAGGAESALSFPFLTAGFSTEIRDCLAQHLAKFLFYSRDEFMKCFPSKSLQGQNLPENSVVAEIIFAPPACRPHSRRRELHTASWGLNPTATFSPSCSN